MPMSAILPAVGAAVAGAVVSSALAPEGPDMSSSNAANNAAAEASKQQAEIAKQQWEAYKNTYLPLEQRYVDEAKDFGSVANQNKSAQEAAAASTAAYASARERLNKTPGINPNSEAYLRATNNIGLAEAANSAAAQTGARQLVKDKGNAMITDALSMGKGLPANASSALGSSAAGLLNAGQSGFNQGQTLYQNGQRTAGQIGSMVGGVFQSKPVQSWLSGGATQPSNAYNIDGTQNMGSSWNAGVLPGQ